MMFIAFTNAAVIYMFLRACTRASLLITLQSDSSPSQSSIFKDNDGDDNLIIGNEAPAATTFNFKEIRPNTGYRAPGHLPPMPNQLG